MNSTRDFRLTKGAWLRRVALAIVAAGLFGGAAAVAGSGIGAPASGIQAASFADRFAASLPDCSKGWPYFEPQCLRGPDASPMRPVRVIPIDRQIGSGDRRRYCFGCAG
jgi:hypothetical protein